MKKTLLLSYALVLSAIGFAQLDSITNPNFDRWVSGAPEGWRIVSGSVAQAGVSDIRGGTNTLQLTTSGTTPGVVVAKKSTDGLPYRMRPVSLTFVCTYTAGSVSDAPKVQVTLTKTIGTQTVIIGSGSSTSAGATYGKQTLTINYANAYKAYAPDMVQISIASSGNAPANGSVFLVDSLEFVHSFPLDPSIITSGVSPRSVPADGGIVNAVAGQPFSFNMTSFIPQTSIISVPFGGSSFTVTTTVDSVKTTNYELSGSASNFLSIAPTPTNGMVGGNSISGISFSGNIPATPADATYNLIITPLMWGISSVDTLANFPSPPTITIYIKVGAGAPGNSITATDKIKWARMQHDGKERVYNVYVPSTYDGSKQVPLLFNVHGWTGSSTKQMDFGNFRPIADTANFLIVQPQALSVDDVPTWDLTGTSDTDFLMALLDSLELKYNIDPNRIYCTGFSQGGQMSYIFGCAHSDRIAAIAPVAGGMSSAITAACAPTHYVPAIITHGTSDPLGPYSSVQACLDYWVKVNGCNPNPVITQIPDITTIDNSTAERWVYEGGKCGATVEHYKITNGGHEWPTLNHTAKNDYGLNDRNNDYEASSEIWRFLSKYRKDQLCVYVAGVDDNAKPENSVSIYPNPSNGKFTLNVKEYANTKLKVTSVLGNVVLETTIQNQYTTVDLSHAAKGVYMYQLTNQAGTVASGKLVIE